MGNGRFNKNQVKEPKEPTLLAKVEISVFSDGNVSVTGPIANPALAMDIFGKALGAVARYTNDQASKNSSIITPVKPKIVVPN